jgi:hypothetical protein
MGAGGELGRKPIRHMGPIRRPCGTHAAPRRSLQVAGRRRNRAERSAGAWVLPVSVTETFYGSNRWIRDSSEGWLSIQIGGSKIFKRLHVCGPTPTCTSEMSISNWLGFLTG